MRAALLVIAVEMGCSTKLAWKSLMFWIGRKAVRARANRCASREALAAKVAVPKSWLVEGVLANAF